MLFCRMNDSATSTNYLTHTGGVAAAPSACCSMNTNIVIHTNTCIRTDISMEMLSTTIFTNTHTSTATASRTAILGIRKSTIMYHAVTTTTIIQGMTPKLTIMTVKSAWKPLEDVRNEGQRKNRREWIFDVFLCSLYTPKCLVHDQR